MKKDALAWIICLSVSLTACRGPIRNPSALTPLPAVTPIRLATITVAPSPTVPPTATPIIIIHQVQSGDTLIAISQKYKASVKAIQQLNGIENSTIYVGQKLKIPQEP